MRGLVEALRPWLYVVTLWEPLVLFAFLGVLGPVGAHPVSAHGAKYCGQTRTLGSADIASGNGPIRRKAVVGRRAGPGARPVEGPTEMMRQEQKFGVGLANWCAWREAEARRRPGLIGVALGA